MWIVSSWQTKLIRAVKPWYLSHTLKKFVWESCTSVMLFLCKFPTWTWNIALICTSWYMNLHELVSKFDSRNVCKRLVQVSWLCVKGIRQTSDLNRISVKYSIRMLYWIMELICVLSVSVIYYRKNIPTSTPVSYTHLTLPTNREV